MILFGDILMDGVVCETSEGEFISGYQYLDFIGCREFLDAVENVGRLIFGQHSA